MNDTPLLPILRRWWWALLLGTALAGAAGFAAASTAPKTYEAQVDLLVGPVNSSVDLDASGSLARTYADLAKSEPVLRSALGPGQRRAADALASKVSTEPLAPAVAPAAPDQRRVDDLRTQVSTSSNAITRIVTVAVRDHDARRAALLANGIGARLESLANTPPPKSSVALDTFSRQSELARLSASGREAVQRAAARVFGASQAGQIGVVQAATAPPKAASPVVSLMAMLAMLAGFCLAALVVLVLELRDRGRLDERSLAQIVPGLLGVVDARCSLEDDVGPDSDTAEGYRLLASRAQLFDMTRGRAPSLLVVDTADGSSAASVAANLAAAVAAEGNRVILVDLDPPGSGVTEVLGLGSRYGYTNVLSDPGILSDDVARLHHALVRRGEWLSVLARGTVAGPRIVSLERLELLVERLRERADVIVLAGAPPNGSSAGIAWPRAVDQVCLAVDSEADGDDVQRVASQLGELGGRFAGAVLCSRGARRQPRVIARAS